MSDLERTPLSQDELAAEAGTGLPDKEVISVLDLNGVLDLGIDAAAPIDLAVAANANVAAPIDAAVSANTLSPEATSIAMADQDSIIMQDLDGEANAMANQDATIEQGETAAGDGADDTTAADSSATDASASADAGAADASETADASSADVSGADTESAASDGAASGGGDAGTTTSESGATGSSES